MAVVTTGQLLALVVAACCFMALPAEGLSIPGGQDRSDNCREGQFWDHGTDKCEPCSDICVHAEGRGTAKACDLQCPGYAAKLTGETEDPGTTKIPTRKPRKDNDLKSDGRMRAIDIVLIVVVAVMFVVFLCLVLAIIYFNRQLLFSLRAPERSGNQGDLQAVLPPQTADEAPLASGVGPGGHHLEAPVVPEAVPLKTPVQESGEGYREARKTMEGEDTAVKTLLPPWREDRA